MVIPPFESHIIGKLLTFFSRVLKLSVKMLYKKEVWIERNRNKYAENQTQRKKAEKKTIK